MKAESTSQRPSVHVLSVFFGLSLYAALSGILDALEYPLLAGVIFLFNAFIRFSLPVAYGLHPVDWPRAYLLYQLPSNMAILALLLVLAGWYCRKHR